MGNTDLTLPNKHSRWIVPLLLLVTVAALGGVFMCGFTNFDDPVYVVDNSFVRHGLTFDTIRWALTHQVENLYHPLSFLSLALDEQLFGSGAAGFHFTNLLIHCVNVVLLFQLLRKTTGDPWRSAWVAAIWAIHPMRVESVAWIAERKDVLMGLFGLGAMHAYVSYVRTRSFSMYAVTGIMLTLSLLAKPALVIMPAVLLLLDFWPLGRTKWWREASMPPPRSWRFLVLEKLPLLAVCGIFVVLGLLNNVGFAVRPPNRGGPLKMPDVAQLGFISYAWYALTLVKFENLAVFYPIPMKWPIWQVIGSIAFLLFSTMFAVLQRRIRPWFFFGWFWFAVIVLPVVWLFRVQTYWRADRYTYLPSIGLLVIIAWSVPTSWVKNRARRIAMIVLTLAILCGLIVASEHDVLYWRDSESLWSHALDVTHDNWMAETNYAIALIDTGDVAGALPHLREAVRLNPGYSLTHYNYGNYFLVQGDRASALAEYRRALELAPNYDAAARAVARLLMQDGRYEETIAALGPAESQNPALRPLLLCCRGNLALQQKNPELAVGEFLRGAQAAPDDMEIRKGLGIAWMADDHPAAAANAFREALRLDPLSDDLQEKLRNAMSRASTRPQG